MTKQGDGHVQDVSRFSGQLKGIFTTVIKLTTASGFFKDSYWLLNYKAWKGNDSHDRFAALLQQFNSQKRGRSASLFFARLVLFVSFSYPFSFPFFYCEWLFLGWDRDFHSSFSTFQSRAQTAFRLHVKIWGIKLMAKKGLWYNDIWKLMTGNCFV